MFCQRNHNLRGLTLIELLISVTIITVVTASVYSAFSIGVFGWRNINKSVETQRHVSQFLERFNADLRNCFAYSESPTMFKGENNKLSFLTIVNSYVNNKSIPEYSFVSYGVQNNTLMRLCRKGSDSLDNKSDTPAEEILSGVDDLSFSYGYIVSGEKEIRFVNSWPKGEDAQLPLAVRLRFNIKNIPDETFETTIYIPMAE